MILGCSDVSPAYSSSVTTKTALSTCSLMDWRLSRSYSCFFSGLGMLLFGFFFLADDAFDPQQNMSTAAIDEYKCCCYLLLLFYD